MKYFPCPLRTMRRLATALLILALFLPVIGCGGGNGDQQSYAHNDQRTSGDNKQPKRERPSQPPIPVAVDEVIAGSISSYYTAMATLEAEKEAEILARVQGVVEALSCEEGDQVRVGSELLRIENDEYRLLLDQAEANTSNQKDKYGRLKGMWEQNLVSAEEYQTIHNDLKAAEAAEGLARLNLSYTRVTAPFTGRVVSRLVDVGQNVNVGTPLFVISDFDPLLARVHVPSKEFKKLKAEQPVELILDSNRRSLQGRIKLVSPIIDPTSGTIKVTIEIFEFPPDTRPGDFAEVRIVTEKRDGTLLVPKTAVFTDRGDQIVFTAVDSTAERRVVEVGFENDIHTEIISGLAAGERVVVKGQRSLKHGAPIKIMEDREVSPQQRKRAGS